MATPTLDRPAPSPDNNHDSGFRRRALTAIGGLGLVAAGYFGYQVIADKTGHDVDKIAHDTIQDELAKQKGDIYNGGSVQATVERPADMTIDNASPDVNGFFNDRYFTDKERIDWAYNVLNQPSSDPEHVGMTYLEVAHGDLQERYNEPGGYKYIDDLVTPSENMTGDQIFALLLSVVETQLHSDLPLDTRLKLAAATLDNSMPQVKRNLTAVTEGNEDAIGGIQMVNVDENGQKIESRPFSHHVLPTGYDPSGIPSKVVDFMDTSSNRYQAIFQFRDAKPVLVESTDWNNPSTRIDNIRTIPAN